MSSGSSNTDPTSGILRTPDGFQTASGRLRQQQSQSSNSSTNQRSGSSPIAFDNRRSQGSLPDNVRRSQSSTVQLQQPLFVLKGPHISPEEAVLFKTQAIRVPDIGSFTPRTNAGQLRQQRSQSRVISLVGTNLLKIIFYRITRLIATYRGMFPKGYTPPKLFFIKNSSSTCAFALSAMLSTRAIVKPSIALQKDLFEGVMSLRTALSWKL